MPDSFGVEQNCIMQICDIFLMCLTCVEEARHVICHTTCLLSSQNGWHEFLNAWCILFLINHIEARNKIRILLFGNSDVIKNLTNMRMSNNFIARQNQTHLEIWYLLLCFINDFLDYRNFIQKRHRLLIFIKKAARGMPQFDYENVLFDASFNI